MSGLIDQQPADAARRQQAKHLVDRSEGRRNERNRHEQGRPEIPKQIAARFIGRGAGAEHIHQRADIVHHLLRGGVDERAVHGHRRDKQIFPLAMDAVGKPRRYKVRRLMATGEEFRVDDAVAKGSSVWFDLLRELADSFTRGQPASLGARDPAGNPADRLRCVEQLLLTLAQCALRRRRRCHSFHRCVRNIREKNPGRLDRNRATSAALSSCSRR